MVSKPKRTFMINEWWGNTQEGTACVYRTDSEEDWWNKIKELSKQYNFTYDNCRIVIRENLSIFSYASTFYGLIAFKTTTILGDQKNIIHPFGNKKAAEAVIA